MDNNMLRRALWVFLRPLITLIINLLSPEVGEETLRELKRFNRKEPCWVPTKNKWEVKNSLLRLLTFPIEGTSGKANYETAWAVFAEGYSSRFEKWGIVFSGVAPKTRVAIHGFAEGGSYSDFLGNTAEQLEKRRLLGSQFLDVCRYHSHRLVRDGYRNFFVLTRGDEVVAKDLSNVFVASVYVDLELGRRFQTELHEFRKNGTWNGDVGHQVFSPPREL